LEPGPTEPTLAELEQKLEQEDELYGELLAALDRLSANPPLHERDPEISGLLAELNRFAAPSPEERARTSPGIKGLLRRLARKLLEPELDALERALARERRFDSLVVQSLNRIAESENAQGARAAEFASALVGFAQRIDRLADAKDRLYASLGNRRSDLLLEAMDKRLESVRLAVAKAQERLEGLSTAVALARAELAALTPSGPSVSYPKGDGPGGGRARESRREAHYVAFEERFRGSVEEIRRRLADYVGDFQGRAPVVDLGCGRGEFLDLLREAGIGGVGVDGNGEMVRACRERGLAAEQGDVLSYLARREAGSAGGIFAAQLVEHLPPREIGSFLEDCHRVLRAEGRLVLETVNPRSLVALVESFFRDLTHEKPLHPETLDFAARAAGFRDVAIRYQSPVPERARLLPIAGPLDEARVLNQNFEKLNAFLYGDLDYAIIATK
jgi:SAM-dependent methyltransferase